MGFYQMMQMGASQIKPLIKEAEDNKVKRKYIAALTIKNILCILFCMVVVTSFTNLLGVTNSIVGVVTVLGILTFRFSNLDFKVGQSVFGIMGIFIIFAVSPFLVTQVHPIIGFLINAISMMAIVVISCHNVALSNQSTLLLSYILLYGYEINTVDDFMNRVFGLILGGLIVAGIFYYKNRKKVFKNSFRDILKDINFFNSRTKWQLKVVLGISIVILIGDVLRLPRVMWIALACQSLLQPDEEKIKERIKIRYPYIIIGALLFALVHVSIPEEFRGLLGMLGGVMVGFSATYQWQTVFNSFGALVVAVPIFGLGLTVIIRIFDNIFGAIYSNIFNKAFNKIYERFTKEESMSQAA